MSVLSSFKRNLDPEAVKKARAKDIRLSLFAVYLLRRLERQKAREKVLRYMQSVKGNKKRPPAVA